MLATVLFFGLLLTNVPNGRCDVYNITDTAFTVSRGGLRIRLDFSNVNTSGFDESLINLYESVRNETSILAASEISKVIGMNRNLSTTFPVIVPRCILRSGDTCLKYNRDADNPGHCTKRNGIYHNPDYLESMSFVDESGTSRMTGGGGGAKDSDVVIYIQIDNNFCTGQLAHGSYCVSEEGSSRPTFGFVNICHKMASYWGGKKRVLTELIVHEMLHVLYFSTSAMRSKWIKPDKTHYTDNELFHVDDDGQQWLKTPAVLRASQNYYGCKDLKGMPLAEYGHVLSKYLAQDVISPKISRESNSVFGELTAAAAEDSGWYVVRRSSHLTFGYKAGCDFLNMNCTEYEERHPNSRVYAPTDKKSTCQPEYQGYGMRYPIYKGCYRHGTQKRCGAYQRCFEFPDKSPECIEAKCVSSKVFVKVDEEFVDCEGTGMLCPTAEDLCRGLTCPSDCNANGLCVSGTCYCDFGYGGDECQYLIQANVDSIDTLSPSLRASDAPENKTGESFGPVNTENVSNHIVTENVSNNIVTGNDTKTVEATKSDLGDTEDAASRTELEEPECVYRVDFATATEVCKKRGKRVCDFEELVSLPPRCNLSRNIYWSSKKCRNGYMSYIFDRKRQRCLRSDSTYGSVQCCDLDVHDEL